MSLGGNVERFIIPLSKVAIESKVQDWCKLPYPDHPKGCPNYGKVNCPPTTKLLNEFASPPYTLLAVRFDFESYLKTMKEKHPNWSERQLRNLLFWQGAVDKQLKDFSEEQQRKIPNSRIIYKPEAYGVNLFVTCMLAGIRLERNPKKYVWKISLLGNYKYPLEVKNSHKLLSEAFG